MADFTNDDMMRMQRDAVRRVQEMNNRARHTLNHANSEIKKEAEKDKGEQSREGKEVTESKMLVPKQISKHLKGMNLGGLSSLLSKLNGDTAILICLGILLLTDEVDELLILALVYIMM